jgi:hypothetical protein
VLDKPIQVKILLKNKNQILIMVLKVIRMKPQILTKKLKAMIKDHTIPKATKQNPMEN